eukprot:1158690-Prymnesium_polylepis.1
MTHCPARAARSNQHAHVSPLHNSILLLTSAAKAEMTCPQLRASPAAPSTMPALHAFDTNLQ